MRFLPRELDPSTLRTVEVAFAASRRRRTAFGKGR